MGEDIIDLSEDVQSEDTLILDILVLDKMRRLYMVSSKEQMEMLLEFNNFGMSGLNFLPLVDTHNVPIGYIDNCLLRIVGDKLN